MEGIDPRLIEVGLEILPEAIDWIKSLWKKRYPDAPELTDAEAKAGFATATAVSLAKGDAWLAAHPPQ